MGSSVITNFSEATFKRFTEALPELELELPEKDKEQVRVLIYAPHIRMIHDFNLVYKDRYLFNFEYMERCLELYVIGERQDDEFVLYKTTQAMEQARLVNQELEHRIIDMLKL